MPFKAGNPSQFDYGNYLRNHNAYAVFYAKNYELLDSEGNPTSSSNVTLTKVNKYGKMNWLYIRTENLWKSLSPTTSRI